MQKSRNLFLLFLFLSHFCFSANNDSLKLVKPNGKVLIFTEKQFNFSDSVTYVDNTLDNFQNYLNRGHLGNSGLAFNNFSYSHFSNEIGFSYSENNFRNYFYTKENLRFYDTHTPYSDLFYVIGSKKEQDFKMTFSYNIKKNWNLTANFFRIRSEGFYERQNSNDNFVSLSSNYKSKCNRYNLLFGFIYNYVQNFENGGISNDSVFENSSGLDTRLLSVNLLYAKRSILNRSVFLNQYINFGKKTLDTTTNASIIPSSFIELSTYYDDNLLKYEDSDPLSGFYSNIYNDSTRTNDSTYNLKFENELSWRRVDNKKHRGFVDMLGASISAKDQFVKIKQRELDTAFNNIIIGAELFNIYTNNRSWVVLSGQYDLSGFNKNDYSFKGTFKKGLVDSLTFLSINVSSGQQAPDFIYSRYSSNNFKWDNNFTKIKENNVGVNLSMKKYKLSVGANYSEYNNPVYFDNYAIARQYNGRISVLSAFLKKDFEIWNWHFNNTIQYQFVPDSTVIRVPGFVLDHSLFYENELFKNAMRVQIGVSLFFVSNYYADSYMPATAQFYIQDDKKYGNYPFIDFFINAKIKSVRMFFKIDHLNSGWMGNGYVQTPHYPMNDRAFKLGISWKFYD